MERKHYFEKLGNSDERRKGTHGKVRTMGFLFAVPWFSLAGSNRP
jgi:hypothetical protein